MAFSFVAMLLVGMPESVQPTTCVRAQNTAAALPSLQLCIEGQTTATLTVGGNSSWPFATTVVSSLEGCTPDPSQPSISVVHDDPETRLSVVQHVVCPPSEYSKEARRATITDSFQAVMQAQVQQQPQDPVAVAALEWNVTVTSDESAYWTAPIVSTVSLQNYSNAAAQVCELKKHLYMQPRSQGPVVKDGCACPI